ncbi:hypothetical protein TNCV_2710281 [Trichonephila clavipes]|nr:hypothetical protein TNCV_2710281 [Trichonephila clavipes]
MEFAGSEAPQVSTRCVSGWEIRIWIRISETPLIFLDISEIKSNGFAFQSRVRVCIFHIATKLSGAASRKYDQRKFPLAIASLGIAAILF